MPKKIDIEFGMSISDELQDHHETGILYTEEDWPRVEYDLDISLAKSSKNKTVTPKRKGRNAKPYLILWDIENINFPYDRVAIEAMLKKIGVRYSMKYISYHIRMDRGIPWWLQQYGDNIEWRKIQLRRLGWVLEEKKDADKQLKKLYYQFVDRISGIVIISSDSDFIEIAKDATERGLNTTVLFDQKIPTWAEQIHGLNAYKLRKKEES
ncbi:MAG: NYN domain-containing protein [Sulfuricurvum sp.]|uniref:NYN domain-containing protein n=1 Tax=Sulfuricurvum sp. TaxID=2025608 RepID=UPI002613EE4F|nr:NYN domain-containing protein [Sulfuricurvum sp.]MDD2368509.1 NYN domain-containing protein [Sulfuricurvum sp.]MDD2949531.1 NYN domain-containing protein [Sulfuricurvum sp.]MDD5118152.1 NYN domain-containing protein [Sulfuricurvum sp.]